MNNRIEDVLQPDDSPPIPVFYHRSAPDDPIQYATQVKRWALQHPVPCLATAFALGALLAWFVKRR